MGNPPRTPADVARECTERYNARDKAGLDLIAPEVLDQGVDSTPEEWGRKWERLWAEVPDMRVTIERTVEAGDWVARRCTTRGTGPDGAFERIGIDMVRVRDGRIVEHWAAVARPASRTLTE